MFNKISFFLLSILPISLILGNFAVNLNLLLINLLLLYCCYKTKNWNWIKDDVFKLLIIFYFYLVINSLVFRYLDVINHNENAGLIRSLTFIKFILFAYAFRLLVTEKKVLDSIILIWCVIIGVVIFDVFFESIFGHNTIGNTYSDPRRIVSFFKDETVVGALILCVGFVTTTYFLNKDLKIKSKIFFNILLLTIPLSILITGERSNFIKGSIVFILIMFFIDKTKLLIGKKSFITFCIFIFFATFFLNQNVFHKQTELLPRILKMENVEKFTDRFQNISYFSHYDAAFEIFKDFPISGVGNKNFRLVCMDEKYLNPDLNFSNRRCSTHPHQVHFELLSEHGLIGYLLFFYIMFVFIKKNLKHTRYNNNIFERTSIIYLIIFLIPLLPSGALFSTFNGTLFWIIFSIANYNTNKEYIN